MTTKLTADAVKAAILKWPGRYTTAAGETVLAVPVSGLASQLREAGWRNVSRLDEHDFRELGLRVIEARYTGGVRPKRFCTVVVA